MNSNKINQAQNDLQQISNTLEASNHKQAHLIDVDLSLDKIRQLYELLTEIKLEVLSNPNGTKQTVVEEPKPVAKQPEPKKEEVKVEKAPEIAPETNIDFVDETVEEAIPTLEAKEELIEILVEPEVEIKEEPVIKKAPKLKAPKTETKPEPVTEKLESEQKVITLDTNETIADQFESKTSLNDLLSNIKENEDLATQLKNSPIDDLKTAISLNDKIWFTRELFAGDNDKYINTIEQFNKLNTMDDALNLANSFAWNKEEDSTQQFLKLIYRKFV
jgi:hypothetical protein